MSLGDVEKSLEAAWDSINNIQEEAKTQNDYKKTFQQSLDTHRQELDLLIVKFKKVDRGTLFNVGSSFGYKTGINGSGRCRNRELEQTRRRRKREHHLKM